MTINHPDPAPRQRVGVLVSSTVRGGAEIYLATLYNALVPLGIDATLFGSVPGWAPSGGQVPVAVGPKWSRRTAWRSILRMRREVRNYKAAVIREEKEHSFAWFHVQYKREQILLSRWLVRRAPVIWTEHGPLPRGPLQRVLVTLYRLASLYATCIICVSEKVRSDLLSHGVTDSKLCVLPNPVDLDRFVPATSELRTSARRALQLQDQELVVLAAGRLHETKRIDLAIAALAQLDRAHLLVLGDGPDRSRLQSLAASGRVTFVGHVDDTLPYLHAADVFVFPSGVAAREGLPIALLEAWATGLPTVCTEDCGVADLAGEAGAVIVEPHAAGLREGILAAAGSREYSMVPGLVARYSASEVAQAYACLFRSLVANPS